MRGRTLRRRPPSCRRTPSCRIILVMRWPPSGGTRTPSVPGSGRSRATVRRLTRRSSRPRSRAPRIWPRGDRPEKPSPLSSRPFVTHVPGAALPRRAIPTAAIALLLALAVPGCAPKRVALPTGAGTPVADATAILAEALGHCAALRTLTAEIALSGQAAGQRLRVRLIAGLAAPDRIRLEATAPFGPPLFILASAGEDTILLLPRDDRVLRGEPPAAILEALAGIRVTPAALRRLLAGCPAE